MRLFRFMSAAEFQNFLNGEEIKGRFVKGRACFLGENVPARKKDENIKQLTDFKSLKFKSTDFDGKMKELTELISPNFKNGEFKGELKELEYLTLEDFMKNVRQDAYAEVLVEFETIDNFEQECDKVIMDYRKYLIEEIQTDGYSNKTLRCISYQIDLINRFRNGIGLDENRRHNFQGVEQTLEEIYRQQEIVNSQEAEHSSNQTSDSSSIVRENTVNSEHCLIFNEQLLEQGLQEMNSQVSISKKDEAINVIARLLNKIKERFVSNEKQIEEEQK